MMNNIIINIGLVFLILLIFVSSQTGIQSNQNRIKNLESDIKVLTSENKIMIEFLKKDNIKYILNEQQQLSLELSKLRDKCLENEIQIVELKGVSK